MLSCKDVATAIASDGLACRGWRHRLQVRLHLLVCRHCRRYAAQIRALGAAARGLFAAEAADEVALERLESKVLDSISGAGSGGPKDA